MEANNLRKRGNCGSRKPVQQGWKKSKKKEPRLVGNPSHSFREFTQAHRQGCFMCYGRKELFQHNDQTCPTHKTDTEAQRKVQGLRKRTLANFRATKVEVSSG